MAGMLLLGTQAAGAAQTPTHPDTAVTGAGSTFAANMFEQWKADFKKAEDVTVSYTAVGSGAGRAQLIAGTVEFGASDVVAKSEEAQQLKDRYGDFVYVPITSGAISVLYQVAGLDALKLSGSTLAKIFSGAVTNWNDPAIAADNGSPGPNLPIQVFVRSDKSGTSGVFTQYLAAVGGADWATGSTETFPTANGQIGKAGSDGVANAVGATNGGIGYAEHSFAVERRLPEAQVKNGAGQYRSPDASNATDAVDDATVKPDGTLTLNFSGPNPNGYPISTLSYVLAPTKLDGHKGDNVKAFLTYALSSDGQGKANALGYAPLPSRIRAQGEAQLAKINPPIAPQAAPARTTAASPAPAITPTPAPTPAPRPVAVPASGPGAQQVTTAAPAEPNALAATGPSKALPLAAAASLILVGGVIIRNTRRRPTGSRV